MSKKIIGAVLCSTLAGSALAEGGVTISGNVDSCLSHYTFPGKSREEVRSGCDAPSRLFFKGSEDLGNGLKAIFALQYHLAIDDNSGVGTAGPQAREQWVGLQGGFGTAIAGRLQGLGSGTIFIPNMIGIGGGALSPLAALSVATQTKAISGTADILGNTDVRYNNAISYSSPSMKGFQVSALYSFAGASSTAVTTESSDGGKVWELGANYKQGPFRIGYVHSQSSDARRAVGAPQGHFYSDGYVQKSDVIGGGYNFGFVDLKGHVQIHKDHGSLGQTMDVRIYALGASVPVTKAGTIHIGLAKRIDNLNSDADALAYSLGYKYALSKRTALYANYLKLNNDTNATGGLFGGPTYAAAAGQDLSMTAVGINHAF